MADAPLKQALREANAELLRRIEELSLVRLVGDALAGEVEPAVIGQALVTILRQEFAVDTGALWIVDALAGGLWLAALVGSHDQAAAVAEGGIIPFSAGLLGEAGAGRAVLIPDVRDVAVGTLPVEMAGLGAVLLYPIIARARTIGVLALGSLEPGGIEAEHERLLGLISPAAAMALENAALYGRLASENRTLRAELQGREHPSGLVGASPAFHQLLVLVDRLADADVTVLIQGASGTGKEVVARALHRGGRRAAGPFVALNCAALPETLLESELFGIERGVATGVAGRAGLVEQANGGTLLLDEIGYMSPSVQAKVLRVLQEREVVRVGGSRRIPIDVRIIAATHRDLEAAVRDGQFREDLYFRLKVVTVRVPSLAERIQDIPLLVQHFLARFAAKHGRTDLRLSPEALALLVARPWPGNVRELENVIEHAVVMATGPAVLPADLGFEQADSGAATDMGYRRARAAAVLGTERTLIERALEAAGHNRTRAARLLGIGRRTLLYKLRRYGLS